MAMGTVTMTDVLSGAVEVPKYIQAGNMSEIYTAAVTTSLASGDLLLGPKIPAGCYLVDVVLDATDLDSAGTPAVTATVGISGTLAKFISTVTLGTAGNVTHMNVGGNLGYSPTTDTQVQVSITGTAGTAVAGTINLGVIYTASP